MTMVIDNNENALNKETSPAAAITDPSNSNEVETAVVTDISMYTLPEYVYPTHKKQRYELMREIDLTPEMQNIFEKLCHYANLPEVNSPVININSFLVYTSGKKDVKAFQKHAFLDPLYRLIKSVVKEKEGIIEVLKQDEVGNPEQIVLKEKEDELSQLYRYIENYFEKSYTDFLDKTGTLLAKSEVNSALSISESHLEGLLLEVTTPKLTLDSLAKLAHCEKPLICFSGNQYIENVIIPTKKIPTLIETFVKFVSTYYQEDLNEEIRHHVLKKVKEQNLNTVRLSRVIREGLIGDAYFLFFSQLFYGIMLSIMDKISQQNFQNKEIYNQCFILYFLSSLSINERNQIMDKKRNEEERNKHYKTIITGLISNSKQRRGRSVYVPFTIREMLQFQVHNPASDNAEKVIKLAKLYDEDELYKLIYEKNFTGHDINDILIFSSSGVKYYFHRVRLIETFLCSLENEREMIESAIYEDWRKDPSKIVDRDKESDFFSLLETQYISAFFKNYLSLAIKTIFASRTKTGSIDYNYLINRLFLTENDKLLLNLNTKALLYRAADIDKKKLVLQRFCELIMDMRTKTPLQINEILDLSFPAIRRSAIRNSEMGRFRKLFFVVREFFSTIILFFGGNRNYLRYLANPYYKLSSQFRMSDESSTATPENKKQQSHKLQSDQSNSTAAKGGVSTSGREGAIDKKSSPTSASNTKPESKKKEIETLLKNVPEVKNLKKITTQLEVDHDLWNIKMGSSRKKIRQMVDNKIETLVERFDASAYSKQNMDMFYSKIVKNLSIDPIGDKNALKRYIFYKAALIQYNKNIK